MWLFHLMSKKRRKRVISAWNVSGYDFNILRSNRFNMQNVEKLCKKIRRFRLGVTFQYCYCRLKKLKCEEGRCNQPGNACVLFCLMLYEANVVRWENSVIISLTNWRINRAWHININFVFHCIGKRNGLFHSSFLPEGIIRRVESLNAWLDTYPSTSDRRSSLTESNRLVLCYTVSS